MPTSPSKVMKIIFHDSPVKKQFRKYETLFEWIQSEQESWQWLVHEANQFAGAGNAIHQTYQRLRQEIENCRSRGAPIGDADGLADQFFDNSSAVLFSGGTTARALDAVRQRFGDSTAGFVYAVRRGTVRIADARNLDDFAAVVIFALPEFEQPSRTGEKLRQERANYREAVSTIIEKAEGSEQALWDEHNREITRARKLFIKQLRRTRSATSAIIEQTSNNQAAALDSIRNVENTYTTFMGLKAPVEYWKKKAGEHDTAEATARRRLVWFFPIAAAVFIVAFTVAGGLLVCFGKDHQPLQLVIGAGLASLITLMFWVGRLLTRLYLSQHHLRHDAEERAVMTETYLALTHEEAANAEDKKIILAALFRTGADGLVKDDGAPDLTFAGLLSRYGAGK